MITWKRLNWISSLIGKFIDNSIGLSKKFKKVCLASVDAYTSFTSDSIKTKNK